MSVRITNSLNQFVKRVEDKAIVGMNEALIKGASEAVGFTPRQSGNLINSQFKQVEKTPTGVVGRVGYTASYALPVHDPDHPQKFRLANAEKEFLKKGFERADPEIRAILRKNLK